MGYDAGLVFLYICQVEDSFGICNFCCKHNMIVMVQRLIICMYKASRHNFLQSNSTAEVQYKRILTYIYPIITEEIRILLF